MADSIYMKSTEAPDEVSIRHNDGDLTIFAFEKSVAVSNGDEAVFFTPSRAKALANWLTVYADIAAANPED